MNLKLSKMACGNLYLLLIILFGLSLNVNGHLSPNFYSSICPKALSIVKQEIAKAIKNEARVGASLLRLHFHDCFVNGCDGSILLDDTSTFKSEKSANPNKNSARGFGVVDNIKASLEKACPGVVSCADILAIASRDAVVHYGGPTWKVRLGRRDSFTANRSAANAFIPQPKFNLSNLTSSFAAVGLSFKDMVVLSGAHTVGFARCTSFRPHIYNDTNIDPTFAKSLQQKCPQNGSDNVLQPLDYQTRFRFDDKYYQNLLDKKGLLHSDQQLYNGNKADCFTKKYAMNQGVFFKDFGKSMIRMGNIKPLTGSNGEIRRNCRKPN
ncbi:peroxidase P7-like [Chenopodium quinoa]|uniref:peroxidase P7-like n=1 Tax=Chenopodium quinoa TaxID=63459 RepID=UPI000B775BEB|nr:peroxidase P7-like [Chenopodium quinoa]